MRFLRSRTIERLHDYVAGDLDEASAAELERLLGRDPEMRAEFERIRESHEALRLLRDRPEPPMAAADALPRIRAAIAAERFAPRARLYLESPATRVYRRLALAATFLLAVTVAYFASRDPAAPAAPPARALVPPPPPEGRLTRLVEAGTRGGMSAAQLLEMLDAAGYEDADAVFRGRGTVLPASSPAPERR